MAVYKVDTDEINNTISNLKALMQEYESYRVEKVPESSVSKGKVHDELNELVAAVNQTWAELYNIVDRTIMFLSKSGENIDRFDKEGANLIK